MMPAPVARSRSSTPKRISASDPPLHRISPIRKTTAQDMHQRRFSSAVFADQRVNLPAAKIERDLIERQYTRKVFGDVVHLEQRSVYRHLSSSRRFPGECD